MTAGNRNAFQCNFGGGMILLQIRTVVVFFFFFVGRHGVRNICNIRCIRKNTLECFKYGCFTLGWQLKFLSLQHFRYVQIEEITIQNGLNDAGKDRNQIIV